MNCEEKKLSETQTIAEKHRVIKKFFMNVLRMSEELAEIDACKIDHSISNETYERLCSFVEHIATDSIEQDKTIPLTMMSINESGTVVRISGSSKLQNRLTFLGIYSGQKITILQNSGNAPIIVMINNSRVAIGRELATCVHLNITKDE